MMFGGFIRILLMPPQLYIGVCELLCPSIVELHTTTEMTCFTRNNSLSPHGYAAPTQGSLATCTVTGTPCTLLNDNYNASFFNATHSLLTIYTVSVSDAGRWSCTLLNLNPETCDLEVKMTPTCSITSLDDTDTNSVVQYQQLKLAVDVRDYYCSTAHNISLQTGNVTTLLIEADSVPSATDNSSSLTLNVTDSHLGIVGLLFTCLDSQRVLSCSGVNMLAPRIPACDITSDKDTETLTLHEEVTLTVGVTAYYDIRGSYCSVDSNFSLLTGDVSHLLNVGVQGLHPETFNVTETHLGSVRLVFNCQVQHWNLSCVGVTELNNKRKPLDQVATSSVLIISASVVGSLVLIVVVAIVIVFVVKRKVNRIKQRSSVQSCSPPYITVGKPISAAYATVEVNNSIRPPSGPGGSHKVDVIDAGGNASVADVVTNGEHTSPWPPRDESDKLSAPSADRPKKEIGVIVQKIVPEDDQACVNEPYASENKLEYTTTKSDTTSV